MYRATTHTKTFRPGNMVSPIFSHYLTLLSPRQTTSPAASTSYGQQGRQTGQNCLLGCGSWVSKLFPRKSFPTLIEYLYEQRSRFAHGDNNVRNPFIEDLYDQEMRLAAMHAVVLLMESLRRLGSRQLTSYSPSYVRTAR